MKYKVKVTQIHPNSRRLPLKYRVDVEATDGEKGWNDYGFIYSRLFVKRYVRKLIKKNEGEKFQPKVVEEFEL